MSGSSTESMSDGSGLSDWAMVDREGDVEDDSYSSTSSVEVVEEVDDHTVRTGTSPQPQFVLRLPSRDPASLESEEDDASEADCPADQSPSFDVIDGSSQHISSGGQDRSFTDGQTASATSPHIGGSMTGSQVVRNEDIENLVAALDQVKSDLPLILSRSISKESGGDSHLSSLDCKHSEPAALESDISTGENSAVKIHGNVVGGKDFLAPALEERLRQLPENLNTDDKDDSLDEANLFGDDSVHSEAITKETIGNTQEILALPVDESMQSSISSTFSFLPRSDTPVSTDLLVAEESQGEHEKKETDSGLISDTVSQPQGEGTTEQEAGYHEDQVDESDIVDTAGGVLAVDTLLTAQLTGSLEEIEGEEEEEEEEAEANRDMFDVAVRVVRSSRDHRPIFLLSLLLSVILWTSICICFGFSIGHNKQGEHIQKLENLLDMCSKRQHHLDASLEEFRQQLDLQHQGFSRSYGTCRKLLYESDERNSYLWSEITKLRYARAANRQETETFTNDDGNNVPEEGSTGSTEDEEEDGFVTVAATVEDFEGDGEGEGVSVVTSFESIDRKDLFEGFDDGSFPEQTKQTIEQGNVKVTDQNEDKSHAEGVEESHQCKLPPEPSGEGTQDGSCRWCFNELNVLREKWMKEKTERETETARAQMWMDLYKEERESCLQISKNNNEKTLNLHNCWKYLTENFTASADFFKSLGMTWTDVQNLWPDQILSAFEHLLRSKQQKPSDQKSRSEKQSEDPDWDSDFSSSEEEKHSDPGQSSWTDTVNEMLNKTKASVSSVNKQIQETWKKVKNKSEALWTKHRPAIYNIQKAFTEKIQEVSKKYQEKLQKKTRGWFQTTGGKSEKQSTTGSEKDSCQRASTKRRPHVERPARETTDSGTTSDSKKKREEFAGKGKKHRILKRFQSLKKEIESIGYKKFKKMGQSQKADILDDLESLHDIPEGLDHVLPEQSKRWVQWQVDFWTAMTDKTTDHKALPFQLSQPCWQAAVLFGEEMLETCRSYKQSYADLHDEGGNMDWEIDWATLRAKLREQQRRKDSSTEDFQPDLDWFTLRAEEREDIRGRFESMAGSENTDWLYELGRERENLRRSKDDDRYDEDTSCDGCDL